MYRWSSCVFSHSWPELSPTIGPSLHRSFLRPKPGPVIESDFSAQAQFWIDSILNLVGLVLSKFKAINEYWSQQSFVRMVGVSTDHRWLRYLGPRMDNASTLLFTPLRSSSQRSLHCFAGKGSPGEMNDLSLPRVRARTTFVPGTFEKFLFVCAPKQCSV